MNVPPCPFCKGKVKLRRGLPNIGNSKTRWGFLECTVCKKRSPKLVPEPHENEIHFRERVLDQWRPK